MARDEVTVVGVCGVGRCSAAATDVVDGLRALVANTPDALLVRTTGCIRRGACGHVEGALVVVQRCDDALSPRATASEVVAREPDVYVRLVHSWLKGHRILRGRR